MLKLPWCLCVCIPGNSIVVEPAEASAREEEEEGERGGGIGVLDVVKAVAPLLIIIGLALGMLVLGYIFVPETLTTPNCKQSPQTMLYYNYNVAWQICSLLLFTYLKHLFYVV